VAYRKSRPVFNQRPPGVQVRQNDHAVVAPCLQATTYTLVRVILEVEGAYGHCTFVYQSGQGLQREVSVRVGIN
jgi:hypothetical protein